MMIMIILLTINSICLFLKITLSWLEEICMDLLDLELSQSPQGFSLVSDHVTSNKMGPLLFLHLLWSAVVKLQ